MGRIVVGMDHSKNARAALQWAMTEATLRGTRIEAVMAWHEPYLGGTAVVPLPIDPSSLEDSHRESLQGIVDEVHTNTPSGAHAEAIVVRGTATAVLLEAADGADLLVVGSRGQGGFLGLLLGSVTQQVVSHAPCPVVVVPALS